MNKTVVLLGMVAFGLVVFMAGTYVGRTHFPSPEKKLLKSYREYFVTTEHMIQNCISVEDHVGHWECYTELSHVDSIALHEETMRINKLYKEQE